MENKSLRAFPEKAKMKLASWALGLTVTAIVIIPVLGLLASGMHRLFDPASVNPTRSILSQAGFSGMLLSALLSLAGAAAGVKAFQKGERSWMMWVGWFLALFILGFWIFMIVGEIAYPH